ncbi:hypothetical protein DSO57_1010539 [Entomophthora muscae]|uniref:Uncharacterized protein n=1 Tax=Entomophthora muscae TaxID=34485 RepID=A0ACC2SVM0_9FUNG|nr:hypothetical protein DSO57_1010539 [Entomophthora muscae]
MIIQHECRVRYDLNQVFARLQRAIHDIALSRQKAVDAFTGTLNTSTSAAISPITSLFATMQKIVTPASSHTVPIIAVACFSDLSCPLRFSTSSSLAASRTLTPAFPINETIPHRLFFVDDIKIQRYDSFQLNMAWIFSLTEVRI